jgi:HEAT repeat protein
MLRDPDADVRGYVADAMGNIRDKRFLAPLVAVLAAQTDTDLEIFSRVISYYRDDAVAALLPPLQSSDVARRLTAAAALAEIADLPTYDIMSKGSSYVKAAGDALVQAMSRNDLAVGAGGYLYFIIAGRTAAIPFLVTALNTYGGTRMATALLNSGEKSLEDAAKAWAKDHGYQITTHEEPGKSRYRWGGG